MKNYINKLGLDEKVISVQDTHSHYEGVLVILRIKGYKVNSALLANSKRKTGQNKMVHQK